MDHLVVDISLSRFCSFYAFKRETADEMRIRDWSADVCSSDLSGRGVERGDAVALLFENRTEALACALAIVKLGAIAAMLNPQQRGELLGHSIGMVKARAIIVGEECRAALESTDYAPGSNTELVHWWDGERAAPEAYQDRARTRLKSSQSC